MHKKYVFTKKVYISILTLAVVFITTFATTYAWVGVLSNSSFEKFDIGVKASKLEEYGIEISTSGEEGTFSTSLSFEDVKLQILKNWGYTNQELTSQAVIDDLFQTLNQDQCTTLPVLNDDGTIKKLGTFTDMYDENTTKYFKFDIYISANKNFDTGSESSYLLDVYLSDGLLKGTVKSKSLVHSFTYSSDFENLEDKTKLSEDESLVLANTTIDDTKVDSSSAARVAFEKYEVVRKGHPEDYTDSSEPNSAVIYQTGTEYPVYNSKTETYSFGSILPDDDNLAVGYYNSTERFYASTYGHTQWVQTVPDDLYAIRGVGKTNADKVLSSDNNHLIDSTNPNEQINVDKMMKVTCYFWFEGWDADCFNAINASPVNINITFNTSNDEKF